jgi:hypothetical protein
MKKTDEQNHAERNASSWTDTINEQVAALKMDWERYQELKDMDAADMTEEEKAELSEFTATAGEFENYDDIQQQIEEGPLSVQVRGGWHNPGDGNDKPEEFEILLSTGGPALRIVGDLDDHGQPERPRLQYQDWGTPWTEHFDVDRDRLLSYCACFYFGE